jgi:hypothetical protein
MKSLAIASLLSLLSVAAWAYDSGIAVQTEKGVSMLLYVNGKLYNKHAENLVRVRSTPGLFHLDVKVLNRKNGIWYSVKKDIRVQKGYELQFKVVFINAKPELREIKKYPIYSRYFLNPNLYNRHPIS